MPFWKKIFSQKLILGMIAAAAAMPVWAQSQPPGTASNTVLAEAHQLVGETFIINGLYLGSKLTFSANGVVRGKPRTGPFTLCEAYIDEVVQHSETIEFKGKRGVLVYDSQTKQLRADRLSEALDIQIATTGDPKDFQSALDSVFSTGLTSVIQQQLPDYWQHYLNPKLPWPADDLSNTKPVDIEHGIPDGVTPLKLVSGPDPTINAHARAAHFGGTVIVSGIVDTHGKLRHIQIRQPLGFGLDDDTVAAVKKYVFKPAKLHGQAVPMKINIQAAIHD